MLGDITKADHIYLACGHTDMRKAIDGLAAIVQQNFKLDSFSNSLFLFCGRKSNRLKVLYWEGDGFVLLYKRLENGRFQWPGNQEEVRLISEQTSSLSMEGQMSIFDEAETTADPKAAEPTLKDVDSYQCRKFKGQREELLKDLPHDKKLCTLAEEDRFCECCNTPLRSVGEDIRPHRS